MSKDDTLMRIVYEHSGEEREVPLSSLFAALVDFLDHFGVKSLVGHSFYGIVQMGDGATKLLSSAGYLTCAGIVEIPKGFFPNCYLNWQRPTAPERLPSTASSCLI